MNKLTQSFRKDPELLFKIYGTTVISGGLVNSIYKSTKEFSDPPLFSFWEGAMYTMWSPVIIPGYLVSYFNSRKHH